MARRKGMARKYTKAQRQEILKRVNAGETQAAVAAQTGVPLATVGYWARKAKRPVTANRKPATSHGRRPAGFDNVANAASRRSEGIAWALEGDTLVIRIPLRVFARKIAEEALAKI